LTSVTNTFTSVGGKITATYTEAVYRDTTTNNMDFVIQFSNAGPDDIFRSTSTDYTGFTIVDAGVTAAVNLNTNPFGYGVSVLGVLPPTMDRSPSGDTIGFNFP